MNLSNFKGRIFFMSMYNDILWRTQGHAENCVANSVNVAAYANKFFRTDVGHFWDLIVRKKWYWNSRQHAKWWMGWESGHLEFRANSALERGELKSKGGGKKSSPFNGSEETVELILRTVISVNQLSIYGAVADLCKKLDPDSMNHIESEICGSLVIPT